MQTQFIQKKYQPYQKLVAWKVSSFVLKEKNWNCKFFSCFHDSFRRWSCRASTEVAAGAVAIQTHRPWAMARAEDWRRGAAALILPAGDRACRPSSSTTTSRPTIWPACTTRRTRCWCRCRSCKARCCRGCSKASPGRWCPGSGTGCICNSNRPIYAQQTPRNEWCCTSARSQRTCTRRCTLRRPPFKDCWTL